MTKRHDELSAIARRASLETFTPENLNNGHFHLSEEDIEKLKTGRTGLAFHERAGLTSFLCVWAGTALLDLGGVLDATIEIDDKSTPRRKTRPYARIRYSDDQRPGYTETIDILKSVRTNALCIGHPVIVYAIHHWQHVLRARRIYEQETVYDRKNGRRRRNGRKSRSAWDQFNGREDVRVAEQNLKALASALKHAPRVDAVSKELALQRNIETRAAYEPLLRLAWERLEAKHLDQEGGLSVRVSKIVRYLSERESIPDAHCGMIESFLKSERVRRDVYDEDDASSHRPQFRVFVNKFFAWFHVLRPATAQDYREKGSKQSQRVDKNDIHHPSFWNPREGHGSFLLHVLTTPLVRVREFSARKRTALRNRRKTATPVSIR